MTSARRVLLTTTAAALLLAPPATAAGGAWHRVDVRTPAGGAERAALDRAGAQAVHGGGAGRYVAWLGPRGARRLAADPAVRAVRPLRPAEKVSGVVRGRGGRVAVLARPGAVVPGALRRTLTAGLAGATTSLLQADARTVAALSRRADVLHVGPAAGPLRPEDEGTVQLLAAGKATPGYEAFLAGRDLSGKGVGVAVVDTGVDRRHPDLEGRVVKPVDYGRAGEPVDSGGHGTHVAGIVGGAGAAVPGLGRPTDARGLRYGLGVAPASTLVDLNGIGTFSSSWPPAYGFDTITRDSLAAKAAIWNGSWTTGEGIGVGYIETARTLDALVRDGDPRTPAAEPYTMVFSAGNSGGPAHRITAPKEAKSIIVVAASNGQRATGSTEAIASFSSRGPARDGRVVPTVTAPGASVASAHALPAARSCSTPVIDAASPGAVFHALCSGTSMASPHVAGSVALLTEQWRREHGADPSPAMSKALLAGTARDLGTPDVPNPLEGWGRVDLGAALDRAGRRATVDQAVRLDEPGDVHAVEVEVGPGEGLRATVAWTDAPGALPADPAHPALVNDLDLVVTAPDGTTYRGNVLADGVSVPGGDADRIDVLEHVRLPDATAGTWRIAVRAVALPGDGVPGAGDSTDQDFALAITR